MMVKAYLNHQGGTMFRVLIQEALLLRLWVEENLLSLKVEHLAGTSDIAADWLSRQQLCEMEWQLYPEVFLEVTKQMEFLVIDCHKPKHSGAKVSFKSRLAGYGGSIPYILQIPWL